MEKLDWWLRGASYLLSVAVIGGGRGASLRNTINMMRLPSRFIPARTDPRLGWTSVLLLAALLVGCGYFIYSSSPLIRYMTGAVVCSIWGYMIVLNRRTTLRLELLAKSRVGESISEFARSFDTRAIDTWVLRTVHQELQAVLHSYMPSFPVRASDLLLADLALDIDDVEDLLQDVAERSSRSLDKTEENPYYGKLNTVMDVVLFINAQPKISL